MLKLVAPLGLVAWLALVATAGEPEPRAMPARVVAQEGLQLQDVATPGTEKQATVLAPRGPFHHFATLSDLLKRFWPLIVFFLALPTVKKLGKAAPYAAVALAAIALGIPFLDPTLHFIGLALQSGLVAGVHLAGHGIELAAGWLGGAAHHLAAVAAGALPPPA